LFLIVGIMGSFLLNIIFFFGITLGTTEVYRVDELRSYFQKATKCAETGQAFHKFMAEYEGQEPRILAFKAASEAVMAKYTWSPYSKMKHLKTSATIFDEAVSLDADDPEIRFLRYTIQYYIPRYLNMSGNMEEDKRIVLNSLMKYPKSGLDAEPGKIMRDVLLKGDHLTEPEKQQLRALKI